MSQPLHVVLGASGAAGREVVKNLTEKNKEVRAASRAKEFEDIETVPADLRYLAQAEESVSGADYVYLCTGLPYETKVWEKEWPLIMNNVITACEKTEARLIFLDNIYMYGPPPLQLPFSEEHPQKPSSRKGKVRKKIADALMLAHRTGRVRAVIGRSADFYGPGVEKSILYISFLERMLKNKNPQFIGKDPELSRTFAYTPDIGRALTALALDEDTYGKVWHLPVSEPVTMVNAAAEFNRVLGTDRKVKTIPRKMFSAAGAFSSDLREVKEMLYQYDHPYIMSTAKFHARFPDFQAVTFREGAREMAHSFMEEKAITAK
jgi:nucleoside-diphosphate-sugar epimerase